MKNPGYNYTRGTKLKMRYNLGNWTIYPLIVRPIVCHNTVMVPGFCDFVRNSPMIQSYHVYHNHSLILDHATWRTINDLKVGKSRFTLNGRKDVFNVKMDENKKRHKAGSRRNRGFQPVGRKASSWWHMASVTPNLRLPSVRGIIRHRLSVTTRLYCLVTGTQWHTCV